LFSASTAATLRVRDIVADRRLSTYSRVPT